MIYYRNCIFSIYISFVLVELDMKTKEVKALEGTEYPWTIEAVFYLLYYLIS